MKDIRASLEQGRFPEFKKAFFSTREGMEH
jgi:queuine/archaeosine tRNA-ribosyltransferase